MKEEEVTECDIQRWYPRFRSCSIKTRIHPLPEPFVAYLLDDSRGLFLPKPAGAPASEALPARPRPRSHSAQVVGGGSDDDDDGRGGYSHWSEEDEAGEEEEQQPSFPQLEEAVQESIEKLGGAVFPKLNWSAPKDTQWISHTGTLRCHSFGEVTLLLKASDTLVHDLVHAFDSCEDKQRDRPETFVLALRKWYDLRPEMEFRGFVRGGIFLGASQREVTGFYPSLVENKVTLETVICDFFLQELCDRFELENYTFDCYVTKDWRVKLIDFNPWALFTLSMLFTWEELEQRYQELRIMQLDLSTQSKMAVLEEENSRTASSKANNVETWKKVNLELARKGMKVELRIVDGEEGHHVLQPNLRIGGGVPYDYIDRGPGSAWEEFLRKAAADEEHEREMAKGG